MADYTDQHVASRTQSNLHDVNVNNLSDQNLFFTLHDAISFQGHGKSQTQDLQLGVLECEVYHNVLLFTESQLILIVCCNYVCYIRLKKTKKCLMNVVR
jgi:hypothetical protein